MVSKQYSPSGADWIELVIPPQNDEEAEYTLRADLSFLMSNWECIYGRGCSGMFGVQSSTVPDDTGCCSDSFYFSDKEDYERTQKMMEELTEDDWDKERMEHVKKNGWARIDNPDPENFKGKGKTFKGSCVFQNLNGGSSGKVGCAFHHLSERTKRDHVDVMPQVCWQLPLRFNEDPDTGISTLSAWDVSEWHTADEFKFLDYRFDCSWWCIDTPDAYIGNSTVMKTMEHEIRETIGDREYDLLTAAIEERVKRGNTFTPPAGAVMNDGRPMLPLLVGERTPAREPSYFPEHLAAVKASQK